MTLSKSLPIELTVTGQHEFLPVVLCVVENGTRALGGGEREILRLLLAAEEIFTHLCGILSPQTPVRLRCASGMTHFSVEMEIPKADVDLRAFNITATVTPENEASLEEMGLMIAARSVDNLEVERRGEAGMAFRIVKEKTYPPAEPVEGLKEATRTKDLEIREAGPEAVKLFIYLLNRNYPPERFPDELRYPGKVVDMVRAELAGTLVALDKTGAVGGGVVWQVLSPRMVTCMGPYVFVKEDRADVTRRLLDGVIGQVARTSALGLINRYPPDEMPPGYFEILGTVRDYREEAGGREESYYYRLLDEDLGSRVWADRSVIPFLEKTYDRLVLPREIIPFHNEGEQLPRHSVLSARYEHPKRRVTLRPLWPGEDMEKNLARHVAVFEKEKMVNILFHIDLGISDEALWIPHLLAQHFIPRLVLPYAGRGDILILQYDPATA